ncbi:hypothetical protein BJ322DRAFT_1188161 [Thelephora terrestris]|uniref:Uncharacterized protein n=1 Tax=Thelephora terrestris TaxID=56493 RepID=A0A9P6L0K3_9AGAM|nr:hypothetical protein BJ322DRAFT_1188161 [Thelephora terrestris]
MVHKGTPLRRVSTSMELPPPSPSQAPTFTQPIWKRKISSDGERTCGQLLRGICSGPLRAILPYTFTVSRTSSSDSSLFPEDLTSEPEDSHSTVKPGRHRTRRLRSRLSDSASQNGQSFESLLPGHDKPGEPSQPKLVEMLKDVSEVLEENTRLKKKRLEREVRKSRLKTRPAARPYDVSSGARASSTSTKTSRKVPGALGKEVAKPLEPMFVDPAPRRSRQNTVSKGKGKEVSKISVEDSMDVDCSVTIDVSMSEDPLPKRVVTKSESPPSQSQSSAKMMPPPPVPPKALKQSPKPKPPPKSTPSKTSYQPPPSAFLNAI